MEKAEGLQTSNTCSDVAVICMVHTLQYTVEDGLKLEGNQTATVQCRQCVGPFYQFTIASDALEKYQHRHNPDKKKPPKLIQDVSA